MDIVVYPCGLNSTAITGGTRSHFGNVSGWHSTRNINVLAVAFVEFGASVGVDLKYFPARNLMPSCGLDLNSGTRAGGKKHHASEEGTEPGKSPN